MLKGKVIVGILPFYDSKNDVNPYQDRVSFVRLIEQIIMDSGAIPIGILNDKVEKYFDICDAYIWPGGNSIENGFYKIFDDAINNHKPILGICLGMQAITTFFNIIEDNKKNANLSFEQTYQINKDANPYLVKINDSILNNHNLYITIDDEESLNNAIHKINIESNNIMYDIYKTNEISVASMHSFMVARVPNDIIVSARADDGVIEAVEYTKNNANILGVQYHPEILRDTKIFNWLIDKVLENNK